MTKDNTDKNIVSNEKIIPVKLERAKKIILELQNELKSLIAEGAGLVREGTIIESQTTQE